MDNNAPAVAEFRLRTDLQVRFNDFDALGHVNNSTYFQYMDVGKVDYISRVLGDSFDLHHETLVIVNVNCQFCQTTLFGEPLEVLSRIDAISEHTVTFEQCVINSDTEEVKAFARTVMVGYSIEKEEKIRIPDNWRKLISAHEQRQL